MGTVRLELTTSGFPGALAPGHTTV